MKTRLPSKACLLVLSLLLPSGACFGSTVGDLIKQGDVYDQKFDPVEALKCYLPAEKLEPDNVDLLLRIARQYRHEMADASSMKEKVRLSGIGLKYAQHAVALAPNDSEAYLSVAICHAKSIELYGNKQKMDALRVMKGALDRALALDSRNDLAWYVLGRWHHQVAELGSIKRKVAEMAYGSLPNATNDDAIRCFCKANGLNPARSPYYIDLGLTYAAMENKEAAKMYIQKGLALPSTGKDDPDAKKRGREALVALK